MRLPTALSLRAVLPAAALAFAPALYGVPAYAAEAEPAACGDRNASDFPIEAHLRGGPDQYALGGGWRGWHLELRNATDTGCRAIHPIAVLVDQAHQLRPRHIGFEFLDPSADGGATWRTVSFQTTDEDENIGVFDDHFKGFTVPAHKTVDVQVRTRFTADAPEGPVTANAIAVQRRADDGDWVGQSNDYVFRIGGAATGSGTGSDTDAGTTGTGTGTGTSTGTTGPDAGTRTRAATRSGGLTEAGTDTGVGAGAATDGDAETKPAPEPTTRSKRPTATPSRTSEETASAAPSRKPSATRSPGAIHKESSPAAVPPRADSDVDADTEADADVGAEADIDSDPSVEEDAGTGADTGTDTDSELGADVDTDMDTDLGADTDPGSDSSADADTGTDTETGTDTGTDTDTETGSDTGTGTDLDEGLETDTDLGTETDPGTDVGTDLGTDTGLGTETDDPGAETDPGREPQTEPSTGTGSDGRHEEDGGHEREHERMPELAATGRHTALLVGLGVISAALVTCGTVLVVRSRRSGV